MMKHIKNFSLFLILPLLLAGCNTGPAAYCNHSYL